MKKDKDIIEFSLDGHTFEADRAALMDYSVTKRIARAEKDALGYFDAMDRIFMGRDEEYVQMLGGGADKGPQLYLAAAKAAGAKNS